MDRESTKSAGAGRRSRRADKAGGGSPGARLALIQRGTLKDQIYLELRSALLAGKFRPGEPLTVKQLAAELGVGIMPVRESVHRLVSEGALVNLQTGRIRVPVFTAHEFEEVKLIRLRLEGLAAALAAQNIGPERLSQLQKQYDQLNRLVGSNASPEAVQQANYNFHFEIYRSAEAPHLLNIINGLWLRVSPLLSVPFKSAEGQRQDYVDLHTDSHSQLMDALSRADAAGAERAVQAIISSSAAWFRDNYAFSEG